MVSGVSTPRRLVVVEGSASLISAGACWYFPTASFLGWVAELSSWRFGLMLRVGTFNTLVVMLDLIITSATVGNHEFLLSSLSTRCTSRTRAADDIANAVI